MFSLIPWNPTYCVCPKIKVCLKPHEGGASLSITYYQGRAQGFVRAGAQNRTCTRCACMCAARACAVMRAVFAYFHAGFCGFRPSGDMLVPR